MMESLQRPADEGTSAHLCEKPPTPSRVILHHTLLCMTVQLPSFHSRCMHLSSFASEKLSVSLLTTSHAIYSCSRK